jgi:hypothetical protein
MQTLRKVAGSLYQELSCIKNAVQTDLNIPFRTLTALQKCYSQENLKGRKCHGRILVFCLLQHVNLSVANYYQC